MQKLDKTFGRKAKFAAFLSREKIVYNFELRHCSFPSKALKVASFAFRSKILVITLHILLFNRQFWSDMCHVIFHHFVKL